MIAIINVSKKPPISGENEYEVRINSTVMAKFKHKRTDGLTVCIQKAAFAVEKAKWEKLNRLYREEK